MPAASTAHPTVEDVSSMKASSTTKDVSDVFAALAGDAAAVPSARNALVPKLVAFAEDQSAKLDVMRTLPQLSDCSFLHVAGLVGSRPLVEALLCRGCPWNAVDSNLETVGDYCLRGGHTDLYRFLVEEGTRTELLLSALEDVAQDSDDTDEDEGTNDVDENDNVDVSVDGKSTADDNEDVAATTTMASDMDDVPCDVNVGATREHIDSYLTTGIEYDAATNGSTLLTDGKGNAVMMTWETPIMERSAELLAPTPGLRVLNVGFGLGIIDRLLQERKPVRHVIIEAHEGVYKKMVADGWDRREGVEILLGRWQDMVPTLTETFDGIYFDTWGEDYGDMKKFHEHIPNILDEQGVYSFFNGLAGTSRFFHDVACRMVECDMLDMGMCVEWDEFSVELPPEEAWGGISRKYYTLDKYRLPKVRFAPM